MVIMGGLSRQNDNTLISMSVFILHMAPYGSARCCAMSCLNTPLDMPACHLSIFTGQVPFLMSNQQYQITESNTKLENCIVL